MQHLPIITTRKAKFSRTIFLVLITIPFIPRMTLSTKTITCLVVLFFVLCDVTVPAYDFSPGMMFNIINISISEKLFSANFLLCSSICLSWLLILVSFASWMMILLLRNSISCNFINSFFTCTRIVAKPKPLLLPFLPIDNSTRQFSCKYVVELKPKSSIRSCFFRSLLRFLI